MERITAKPATTNPVIFVANLRCDELRFIRTLSKNIRCRPEGEGSRAGWVSRRGTCRQDRKGQSPPEARPRRIQPCLPFGPQGQTGMVNKTRFTLSTSSTPSMSHRHGPTEPAGTRQPRVGRLTADGSTPAVRPCSALFTFWGARAPGRIRGNPRAFDRRESSG